MEVGDKVVCVISGISTSDYGSETKIVKDNIYTLASVGSFMGIPSCCIEENDITWMLDKFRKAEPAKRKTNATTKALVKDLTIGDGIEKPIRKIELA